MYPNKDEFIWLTYVLNAELVINCYYCPYRVEGGTICTMSWDGRCPTIESYSAWVKRNTKTIKGNHIVLP